LYYFKVQLFGTSSHFVTGIFVRNAGCIYLHCNKVQQFGISSGYRLKTDVLSCGKESVEKELKEIQYNVPELFV